MESRIEFLKKYISIIIGSLVFAAGVEIFFISKKKTSPYMASFDIKIC